MRIISDRISVNENAGKVSVVILGKIERWKESLLLFWLLAWTFSGVVFLYYYLFPSPYQYALVMLIFLMFWLYFELKIGKVFLWRRVGFEYLEFDHASFSIKNDIKGFGKILSFNIQEINKFEAIVQSQKNFFAFMEQSFWVIGGEQIYFRYKNKDIIFGKQISIKEQKALLQILNGALKNKKKQIKQGG